MQITFEIDDKLLGSIEQYLATQQRTDVDPTTKAQRIVRVYPDVASLLEDAAQQIIHHCVQQYPPDHLREQIGAARQAAEDLKAMARPKRVDTAAPMGKV